MDEIVSVIITTYKGEDHICRAVDSVISQSYKNIEIIVVDDNGMGTEHQITTHRVLHKYIDCNQLRYITHSENRNGSAARNTGVNAARGKYVCLLDDDDQFLPSKIERQLARFSELSVDYGMVYCSFHVYEADHYERDVIARKDGDISLELLLGKMRIATSLLMIKKEAYLAVGGFDESFKRHQDWEFIIRFCQKYKVSYVSEVCVNKYMLERNTPESGELAAEYRLYYLEKMQPIIKTFTFDDQHRVYAKFNLEIAKTYFECKEYKKFRIYARKVGHPVKVSKMLIREFFKPKVKKFLGILYSQKRRH